LWGWQILGIEIFTARFRANFFQKKHPEEELSQQLHLSIWVDSDPAKYPYIAVNRCWDGRFQGF